MAETTKYAGLTAGQLNLIVFENQQQLQKLLGQLGFSTREGRVINADGHAESCRTCEQAIKLDNLGNVMPGSLLVFCDDPFCVMDYVAEHLPEEDSGPVPSPGLARVSA